MLEIMLDAQDAQALVTELVQLTVHLIVLQHAIQLAARLIVVLHVPKHAPIIVVILLALVYVKVHVPIADAHQAVTTTATHLAETAVREVGLGIVRVETVQLTVIEGVKTAVMLNASIRVITHV